MPITEITSQPAANSLNAAYRPVAFQIGALKTGSPVPAIGDQPPVVYCDIYFNGQYYKSLSRTQYEKMNISGDAFDYYFDIQDACQEYLKKYLAPFGGSQIETATGAAVSVYCRFRSSGYDTDGFIVPEGTTPVQGTGSMQPSPGTGTQTNTFVVLNCALQHEDNQILSDHLESYKTGIWDAAAYPLTHRPALGFLSRENNDYFPFIYTGVKTLSKIRINYTLIGQTTVRQATANVTPALPSKDVLYLPNGPKNLAGLFPSLDFSEILQYYTQALASDDAVIATSTLNVLIRDYHETTRVHFLNYLGTVDGITMQLYERMHDSKSSSRENPLKHPLQRTAHGQNRFNVKSTDALQLRTVDYTEADMPWIDELFDAPLCWIEGFGAQGQSADYLPVVVGDKKNQKLKEEDRYTYEITLDVKLSHERFIIRN